MTLGTSTFKPTPPAKGSFPLDHFGECKTFMISYMECLHITKNKNSECREQARDYLGCRMDKGLMAKEEWAKLGYADMVPSDASQDPKEIDVIVTVTAQTQNSAGKTENISSKTDSQPDVNISPGSKNT